MKKRLISAFLGIVLCLGLCVPAFATSDPVTPLTDVPDVPLTSEDEMPEIILTRGSPENTLEISSRKEWAESTCRVLEDAYSQRVQSVSEDKDYIIFTFEEPKRVAGDTNYIGRVDYLKPESQLATTSYSTKITYMYGWGDGYYSLEEQSGRWDLVKNLTITVAGLGKKLTIASFAASMLGISADYIKPAEPVRAANTAQYYLMNKIGQLKDPRTGLWGMYVYVGSRRAFYRTILEKKDSYGHYDTLGYEETKPDSLTNPSNYDKVEFKAHYQDNSWIIDKTKNVFENAAKAYMDVYGYPKYFSETVPKK